MAKKTTTKKKKTPQKASRLKPLIKWIFVLGVWLCIGLGLLTLWYGRELPEITQNLSFELQNAISIEAADGTTLARYGQSKGESVTVEDLPPHLIYALLSIEDRRFYQHGGVDPLGIARAMIRNVRAGRFVQGGSTITQQLAKNLFLTRERKIKRKIQEALLALWLERELTKDEILSAYLNRVYLGAGAYGIEAAGQLYFNKSARDVTLSESALLAGLLKAPSRYAPTRNPELAHKRRAVVLKAMATAGYISKDKAYKRAVEPLPTYAHNQRPEAVRYYTDWVLDQLPKLIGTPRGDLIIQTTLIPDIQKQAISALKTHTQTQGAILVMDKGGAILSMVGGRDYGTSQFNRATQARRPPGSAFKPILYLSALEQGWRPEDTILDAPIDQGEYRPKNFADKYGGEVRLNDALAFSLNTAAVRLMKSVGPRTVIKTAQNLGISAPLEADLSLALGSNGISLFQLTKAYGAFANNGLMSKPYAITRIADREGRVYYEHPRRIRTERVAERGDVRALRAMMEDVVEYGTGKNAQVKTHKIAGKTGTSQKYRDAWFIGFTDKIIAGVWLGHDDNSPMDGTTGGGAPARIFREVMTTALNAPKSKRTVEPTTAPSGFNSLLDHLLSGENRKRGYND